MKAAWICGVGGLVLALVMGPLALPNLLQAEELGPALTPISGQAWRVWQDDSGYHRIRGKLVALDGRRVRLLKQNQRVTTVPLERLSVADRAFVSEMQAVLNPILSSVSPRSTLSEAAQSVAPARSGPIVASVTLSQEFLQRFLQDVNRTQPLATTILGIPIRGWSHTTASVDLMLIPTAEQAVLEIPIRGQVASQTVGTASVARIHSHSLTDFKKSLRVCLSSAGVSVQPLELATANRFINSSVSTTARVMSRLVTRLASRRVRANKPAADQIARQQERWRINQAFETVTREQVGKLNRMLREFLLAAGDASVVRDATLGFSTSQAALHVAVFNEDVTQDLPPAPQVAGDVPMAVQLHSSMFVKAAETNATDMTAKLQRLAEGESAALQVIKREIEAGEFSSSWSDDESWLTITWQPTP